jgi:CHASE2 domain-containing sensor protein
MDSALLVPIAMFVCIVYAIKVVMDARVRRLMINSGTSQELVASLLRGEEQRQRHSSLRWGIVLLALAIGFGIIQWAGWTDLTPGVIAVLAGVTGLGNLAFYTIARRLD